MTDEVTYCYVALLDVLGYRARLEQDIESGALTFKDQLQRALVVLGTVNEAEFSYAAISDTVILSSSNRPQIIPLLHTLKRVFLGFLGEGLFVRGALTFGPHFKSANVTYSHALAAAYQLQSTKAIYPRILIDHNVLEMFESTTGLGELVGSQLVCAANGVYFLNVLDSKNWNGVYEAAKAAFLASENSLRADEGAFLKHVWFQDYLFGSPYANSGAPRFVPGAHLISEA
jgi:hypothetical protein